MSQTVHRIIALFGIDRCMFASNYPVDFNDKWPADRLFPALLRLASPYTLEEQKKLFGENVLKLYQAPRGGCWVDAGWRWCVCV